VLSVVLKSFVADNCKATIEWYKKRFDIMLSLIIILATVAILGLILAKPKWGSFLIWPILFTYPHRWWFDHQFLPLNIGVDDLFCIVLFLVVLIRRNLLGSVPIRFGYAFWTISSFVIVVIIANLAGYKDIVSPFVRTDSIKDILKLGVYWCLFYAIIHCIDNERDFKMQLTMFSLAIVAGAVIVILQYFFPYRMEIFTSPKVQAALAGEATRTTGAFLNANSAACMLSCSLMLIIATIRLQKNIIFKVFVYTFIFVLLIGILLTKSRSGLLSLGVVIFLMGILGRSKKVAWLILITAIFVSMTLPGFRGAFLRRIQRTSDIKQDPSVVGRAQTWSDYFSTATAKTYLLGQGVSRAREINGTESHSSYVSLITVYGIGGVIWALVALAIFFRKVLILRNFPDPLISTVSAGCMWAIINWGIYSIMADALNTPHPRYLLFYLVVLIDRAYSIAGQQQELLSYDEGVGEMEYAGVESY
jgi:hypothetical protein